jgi:hypothetical protein
MASKSVLSQPAWIANFEPCIRSGLVLNDDLMRMLTLLEACECCFAGADLPTIGSELRDFGAEGADQSGTPFVKSAPTPDGNGSCGMPRRPSVDAMELWVVSAPKVWRMWWP